MSAANAESTIAPAQAQTGGGFRPAILAAASAAAGMRATTRPPTTESLERRMRALRAVELFASLGDTELRELADCLRERRYSPDEAIIRADDSAGTHLLLVAEGEVAVILENENGKEAVVATLGAGDFFGEMSLFDAEPRAATVRSMGKTRILLLRREDFQARLRKSPALAASLVSELSRRLRHGNRRIACLAHNKVEARVAEALLVLLEERGVRTREEGVPGVVIRNRPTQKFLADIAGTTRESVSRALADWARQGILAVRGRDWVVYEEDRLRSFAV